jgi:hypothetical protein
MAISGEGMSGGVGITLRCPTVWAGFAFSLLVLTAQPVQAQFYVRSPEIEKGVLKFEEHGAVYSGPGQDERLRQSHEVEGKYGFTDRFEGILEGFFDQDIGGSLTARQLELGGQYELVQREGDGLGVAFRGIYEFGLGNGDPDEILFGPLAKYVWGPDSATINTFFIGQVGNNVGIDSLEMMVNWRLKHELSETLALGVEGYSQIDDLSHPGTFDEQKHRLGPVAYFEFKDLLPRWEFAGGTLFGLSDATSDVTFKFDAELEF